jgi:hypothetical protein
MKNIDGLSNSLDRLKTPVSSRERLFVHLGRKIEQAHLFIATALIS